MFFFPCAKIAKFGQYGFLRAFFEFKNRFFFQIFFTVSNILNVGSEYRVFEYTFSKQVYPEIPIATGLVGNGNGSNPVILPFHPMDGIP